MWDGSQARQATWFNEKLKRAEADFEFYQLCQSTTVTMSKSGAIAVFSPEHALEHAQGTNKGTMRAPSNRKREDLLARSLAKATAATASPTPAGAQGGTPTPTSVPVPTATTYAAATSGVKPTTMLEDMLGELASNYRLSSETIEKSQLAFLNYFLDGIDSARLADTWRKKCDKSGTEFIIKFIADMSSKGVSITAEETIETTMRQMLDAGLASYGDVNFTNYLEFTGAYEELNDVRTHKIDDASLAHQFKRLIVSLGPTFNQSILLRIALLEGEARARGEDPNADPVAIVNEAAGVVLEDEANTELLKQVKQGRAFMGTGFDPQRNQRSAPPGGQTWSTKTRAARRRTCRACGTASSARRRTRSTRTSATTSICSALTPPSRRRTR